jgi:hypothetical protein
MRRTRSGNYLSIPISRALTDVPYRAYIAASRRSDRSLEARLESARRASEIHKRRTGKALRVTEADVQNEEMYEEEDDLPASFVYGMGPTGLEFRLRMQAYYEGQQALRNAMAYASAGGNLNALPPQPPMTLRDYYQRFAQQYPFNWASNQYLFPPPQMPATMQPSLAQQQVSPIPIPNPSSPSVSSKSSSPAKSPVANHTRRVSASIAPYSTVNSQRNRRTSANAVLTSKPVPIKSEPEVKSETFMTPQTFQSPIHPFSTQLPTHLQQYNLADFVDPMPSIPVRSIPMDNAASDDATSAANDFFTTSTDWQDFVSQNQQVPSKITPYDDGTNWEDYLQGDANWVFSSQSEEEQQ